MKITGNQRTVKFEVESPDEVPVLREFGSKFAGWCGSFANADRSVIGIEIATKALFHGGPLPNDPSSPTPTSKTSDCQPEREKAFGAAPPLDPKE